MVDQSHCTAGLTAQPVRFVRRDAHRSPLQCPYEGPFKVITAGEKSFTIDRGGKIENISVNRLKPAHVDLDALLNLYVPRGRGQPRKHPVEAPQSAGKSAPVQTKE